jgi:alanine racemase
LKSSSPEQNSDASESNLSGHRPTWAGIDLEALASNLGIVRERVGPGVKVMAVVKANAYGHGAIECARRLAAQNVDWFAVATPEEGLELRTAGIEQPILSLGGLWEGQAPLCLRHSIVPVVFRLDTIGAIDRAAADARKIADVHLKIDTGMGRLGVRHDEINQFADALNAYKHIRVDGLMTHFAAADIPDREPFTKLQLNRFRQAVQSLRERGHNPSFEDSANSAATLGLPESWGNMVRPGGVLYGLWRDILPSDLDGSRLRPVMSLRSCITMLKKVHPGETLGYGCTFEAVKEMIVGTLPIGYNDGYMRRLSNQGRVIVRGTFAPVVGRVSMDLTIVDVTSVEGVTLDDEVTLIGEDGGLAITAEELAQTAGTLSYEITCGISGRVPRRYE